MIEIKRFAGVFEALGHETRLAILQKLLLAGAEGVHAGAISEALCLPPSKLSFHLRCLTGVGLIESRRAGRHLYYAVRYAELSALIGFLADDCCAAVPTGCLPHCPTMNEKPSTEACGRISRSDEEGLQKEDDNEIPSTVEP
jgi:DNA-binding transcriptional ArsR family regulator